MPSSTLKILLYRSLLRWARDHKAIPFSIRTNDLYSIVPRLRGSPPNTLDDSTAVISLTRQIFRENRYLPPNQASNAIDKAMEALFLLNTTYSSLLEDMKRIRDDRQHRNNVTYHIGDVFIHKKHGYRGVIYGWDRHCLRDEDWVKQFNANPDEAHYYALPDESDCLRLLGGPRLTKYVGESNILKLDTVRIVHRALDFHFIGYSVTKNRYIPVKRIQYEYPDPDAYGYDEKRLVPAEEDANLLKHHPERSLDGEEILGQSKSTEGGEAESTVVSPHIKEKVV